MRDWRSILGERFPNLSQDPAREAEILEELNQHLQDRFDAARARGLSEQEAIREVTEELAASELAAGEIRRLDRGRKVPLPPSHSGWTLSGLWNDFRYSLRVLRRSPWFGISAIVILAVGIASTTSIFSVVNRLLIRPLPYPNSDRLMLLGHPNPDGHPANLGFATLQDWRQASDSFEQFSAIRYWSPTLQTEGGARRLAAIMVNFNYFQMLGVQPMLGRDFLPEEDHPKQHYSVVLSHQLWEQEFGSALSIIGKSVRLNDREYEVVGVMPEDFQDLAGGHAYNEPTLLWGVLGYDLSLPWACRGCQHLKAVGRLRAGVSLEAARAEVGGIQANLNKEHPADYSEHESAAVSRLQDELTRLIRPALGVLSVAVALLLLITCANVANMFLVRGLQRRRELSLRSAIGAGRPQLIRQLLTESLVLGGLGGAVGLLLAPLAIRFLTSLAPASVRGLEQIPIDWKVVLFALGASILSSVLFGFAPSLFLVGTDVMETLRGESRSSAGRGMMRCQRILVGLDLTLALVLLCGSFLMIRTVRNLLAVDPGFDSQSLLTAQISFPGSRYDDEKVLQGTLQQVMEGIDALPGVRGVAATSLLPLSGSHDAYSLHRRDHPQANPAEAPYGLLYAVTPNYFDLMGIRLLRGRLLGSQDRQGAPEALLLSESTAARLWPGEDPLGKALRLGPADEGPWWTVVGVVNDVHHHDLDSPPQEQVYVSLLQRPMPFLVLALRTEPGQAVGALLPAAVTQIAPGVPVFNSAEMDQLISSVAADRRFVGLLLTAFATAAGLLTAVGIYSLASYSVHQRTHELGIRIALGATRSRVTRLILAQGFRVAIPGLLVGLLAIALLTRRLDRLLFGVDPLEPAILGISVLALLAVLLGSYLLPLRRALGVDPAIVLRGD